MKAALLVGFFLWQAAVASDLPVAQPSAMRYERALHVPASSGQACAVLDGSIFPHAAPSLADVRIFAAQSATGTPHEIPYIVTLSDAVTEETQPARLLNLGYVGGKIAFDLEMPQRAYTEVTLQIDPAVKDFLAIATVSGSDTLHDGTATALGSFTLFDLTAQNLSRDTTLPLAESTFRYLHVVMSVANALGSGGEAVTDSAAKFALAMVQGAEVPPSREAQILYTTVAQTSSITTADGESRATFLLPARIPVERVSFVLAPGFKGNFSRDVRVTALAESDDGPSGDARPPLSERVAGSILHVHTTESGREVRTEQLGIPAILGANLQVAAKVEIVIENGDDQPLPITAVRLQMRQREVCFNAAAADSGELALFYGDPKLAGPAYDDERLFAASAEAVAAQLGPEMLNASYRAPEDGVRPFPARHPEVVWIALIALICMLGMIALKALQHGND
jgi:hypothetical protein